MNKTLLIAMIGLMTLVSCRSKQYLDNYAPEERALNVMKITDEERTTVIGTSYYNFPKAFAGTTYSGSKKSKICWAPARFLAVSPNGEELAYKTRENKQDNIMTRKTSANGSATQRTFRDVNDFSWGIDDKLYFSGNRGSEGIAAIDAHAGTLVRQLTSNDITDKHPALSSDGKKLFFSRIDNSGPSIWMLDLESGALTQCAIGYNPCPIPGDNESFICVRNNTSGNSEIWLVNYVRGVESVLLSDKNVGYSNPSLSPDGHWIVCQGNAKSSINKKQNLDIFAVRTDGTGLVQLTYHPASDCCPVFSKDGNHIYFISSRASKKNHYNVWRMNFNAYAY